MPPPRTQCLFLHFSMLAPMLFSLMICGSESVCLGVETKHAAMEVLQKFFFAEIGFLMIPGSIFHVGGVNANFHDLCFLETSVKLDDFSLRSWGHPGSWDQMKDAVCRIEETLRSLSESESSNTNVFWIRIPHRASGPLQ